MKQTGRIALAALGGFIGGFVVYELIVRLVMRLFEEVPVAFIGTLSMLLPCAGAVAAGIAAARRRPPR
ncbi:hypothetical protein [Paenibacillus flagellatus]|uniref:Uncharacterized protein n=1 Tax=Paenibacillus flagellatus TaxID=2211139 RepID=A0A2V5K9I4_9BACL|nr:hypothetical protein [Paenibacillus flagellatus]PYI56195.1 hypothetical protein DLM86_04185 [Paenibacillus flagellatus]